MPLYCNEFVEEDKIEDINTNITYVDMLNKESSELLVNSLAEKDIQITELQKQLKETKVDLSLARNEINTLKGNLTILNEHKKIIEEQYLEKCKEFNSQPAEIVEKIKEQLIKRLNTIAGYGRMTTDELSFLIETELGSDLDDILKEYQKGEN